MHPTRSSGLTGAIVLALAGATHGEPLAVQTIGALPFSSAELDAALALRAQLATAGSTRLIEARVAADGDRVRIDVPGRERTVALDGQQGPDAARLVAFAIIDLAGDQLDPPPSVEVAVTVREIEKAPAGSIAAWGTAGSRSAAMLEASIPISQRLRIVAAAGAGLPATATVMNHSVRYRAFPARLGLAVRIGPPGIEMRASVIAIAEHAAADRSEITVNLGAGAAFVWHVPLSTNIGLLAGTGVDGFATATEYRVNGTPIVTTDRFAWWAGAGIEVLR